MTAIKYPKYDVYKIIETLRNPKPDLLNVLAHRASRLQVGSTENSCSAVSAAARDGYEAIEIDVRLTKDLQVVVIHDEGLGRLTNVESQAGEPSYNPFSGKGFSPLVKDTCWFGELEHLYLRDLQGQVTTEHPILFRELLDYIRREGINIVVQIDVKEVEAMEHCYKEMMERSNAAGVPATEWCIWKPKGELYPTPAHWESQKWVRSALEAGHAMHFVPLLERQADLESIAAWAKCPYLLTFEIHVPRENDPLQPALDLIHQEKKGVGSWLIDGDLGKEYYAGTATVQWDDSAYRQDILTSGIHVPVHLAEWTGVKTVGAELGKPLAGINPDGRTRLERLLEQGFTYIVADPMDDLHARLAELGRRNLSWIMQ